MSTGTHAAVVDEPTPPQSSSLPEGTTGEVEPHPARRFPRIQLGTTVRLRFRSAEAAIESRTVDISEGGVFIRMSNPRPEGTPIRVQLELGERRLDIGGVVVRCVRPGEGEPTGVGVLFTEITPDDLATVKALVRASLGLS